MAEDYPYALDLELVDSQGRKTGLLHVRAASAGEFLAEMRELDADFATAVGEAVKGIRAHTLIVTELGGKPAASSRQAPTQGHGGGYSRPRPSRQSYSSEAPDDWPSDVPPAAEAPECAHGPMKYVPAGTSRVGKPYSAFWGCPADRSDPTRCKSVSA